MSLFRVFSSNLSRSLVKLPKYYFAAQTGPRRLTDEITVTEGCLKVKYNY